MKQHWPVFYRRCLCAALSCMILLQAYPVIAFADAPSTADSARARISQSTEEVSAEEAERPDGEEPDEPVPAPDSEETAAAPAEPSDEDEPAETPEAEAPAQPAQTQAGETPAAAPETPDEPEAPEAAGDAEPPAVGDIVQIGDLSYKVTSLPADGQNGTLTVQDGTKVSGELTIANGLEYQGGRYDVTEIAANAFYGNTALTGVDATASSISKYGTNAFCDCSALQYFLFPENSVANLTSFGIFKKCTSLTSMEIPMGSFGGNAFTLSGLKELTVLAFYGNAQANSFTGLPDGFTLTCTGGVYSSSINASAFGSTKNVTLYLPTDELKESYTQTFQNNPNVTVKRIGEDEGLEKVGALLQDGSGAPQNQKDLASAIQAINASQSEGPFTITVLNTSELVVWPQDLAPNKPTLIDFSGNSVDLPDTLTLQAPLTIRSVTNFNTDNGLCTLDAGSHAFQMINGGSFGFREIRGSDLTFTGGVPGSDSMGAPVQLTGTGESPAVTYSQIGSGTSYYALPPMQGFDRLVLDRSFLKADHYGQYTGQLSGTQSVILNEGGLQLHQPAQIPSLQGNGVLSFEGSGALAVTEGASGSFQLPEFSGTTLDPALLTLPEGAQVSLTNKDGEPLQPPAPAAATVLGGSMTTETGFASFEEALEAIAADEQLASSSYTVTLNADVTLAQDTTLPDAPLTIDGAGHRFAAEEAVQTITFPNSTTFQNIVLDLEGTTIRYAPLKGGERTLLFAASASGAIGEILDDSQSRWLDIKLENPDLSFQKITGTTSSIGTRLTDLFLTGRGSKEAPLDLRGKVENLAAVDLDHTWLAASGDMTALGIIRTSTTDSGGGFVITGDTTVQKFSLKKDTTFQILLPADSTLTLTQKMNNNFVTPLYLSTSTPVDGHVLAVVPSTPSTKTPAFALAGTEDTLRLYWDKEQKEYQLSLPPVITVGKDSAGNGTGYYQLDLELKDAQGIASVEVNGAAVTIQSAPSLTLPGKDMPYQPGQNKVTVTDGSGNTAEFLFQWYLAADYSKVDAALEKIPTDLTLYTASSVEALNKAREAIVRGLDVSQQSMVDRYAADLQAALKNLVKRADVIYTVTYKITGDHFTDTVIASQHYTMGKTIKAPKAPAHSGYTFSGWKDLPKTMPEKDITVTGSYTKDAVPPDSGSDSGSGSGGGSGSSATATPAPAPAPTATPIVPSTAVIRPNRTPAPTASPEATAKPTEAPTETPAPESASEPASEPAESQPDSSAQQTDGGSILPFLGIGVVAIAVLVILALVLRRQRGGQD